MRLTGLFVGAAVGAGLMYLFDPHAGFCQRLILHDQIAEAKTSAASKIDDACETVGGLFTEVASELKLNGSLAAPSDSMLRDCVRAALNRKITYAHAIQVDVVNGRATLHGPILAHDLLPALSAARAVPGISSVDSRLDVHYTPANAPEFTTSDSRAQPLL